MRAVWTERQRREARRKTVRAAFVALENRERIHYTQGPRRWEGIDKGLRVWRGQCPNYADCSSFATWCLWQGLGHFRLPDLVNGARWEAGYTGTMVSHGKQVVHEGNVLVGDLALYGNPLGGSGHVAIVARVGRGGIRVISFGSEPGPFLLPLRYRSDLKQIRRYI